MAPPRDLYSWALARIRKTRNGVLGWGVFGLSFFSVITFSNIHAQNLHMSLLSARVIKSDMCNYRPQNLHMSRTFCGPLTTWEMCKISLSQPRKIPTKIFVTGVNPMVEIASHGKMPKLLTQHLPTCLLKVGKIKKIIINKLKM